jgi:ABC-type sugar transport system substrate-binding protein
MKRFGCIALSLTAALLAGCGAKQDAAAPAADGKKTVTVGFSQIGAESAWRTANTRVGQGARRRSAASS